jgi:hypothetical protein
LIKVVVSEALRYKICDTCNRRNCKKKPDKYGECNNAIKHKEGWPMEEIVWEK